MITRRLQYELVGRVAAPFLMKFDQWQTARKAKRSGRPSNALFGPPLESNRPLRALMTSYYLRGRYADGAVPVAWVTSGFPFEALEQLGYFVIYPENHAALCGARKLVPKISEAAEKEGFSMDLCSYARTDLGNVLKQSTPVGRLPKPDLLCCCTNICQTVLYWYRNLADYLKVPLVLIDTPFIYNASKEHHLQYVVDQLEEMIAVAEGIAGRKLDRQKFVEVMSRRARSQPAVGRMPGHGQGATVALDRFRYVFPHCADRYHARHGEMQCVLSAPVG